MNKFTTCCSVPEQLDMLNNSTDQFDMLKIIDKLTLSLDSLSNELQHIKKCINDVDSNDVPPHFISANEFEEKYMFISDTTVNKIIKEQKIYTVKNLGTRYFDPKDIVKCFIGKKYNRARLMNQFCMCSKLNPSLQQLIQEIKEEKS